MSVINQINLDGDFYGVTINKGDIIVNDGIKNNALPVATNGYILTADSAQFLGMKWESILNVFTGFSDGTVSAPGIYWLSQATTGLYRPGSGQIYITLAGTNTAGFTTTSTFTSVTLSLTGTGSTTTTSSTLYSNPASTVFSGANNYFFNYFNTPTTTGSTTGIASTIFIAGAPANATTSYALNIATGNTLMGGNLILNATSAILALSGASSILTLANTTASTSASTGALQCAGGAYFGANSLYNANITMQGASAILSLSGTSAILALQGASSILTLANTTASTSASTGALQCAGGAYFGANSLYNANVTMQGASAILALSGTSAILALQGASSILTLANTTASTSASTGALQCAGGMSVKNIWLAGVGFSNQAVSLNGSIFNTPATTITATNTADMAFLSIQQPTLANSVASSTTVNASTLYIADAPLAGTNQTITNAFALNVNAGKVRVGGSLQIPTGASNGYILTSDTSGNASWEPPSTYLNVNSTATFSTTSTSLVDISLMSINPTVAGVYIINFTTNFRVSNNNRIATFDLSLNGTSVTNTQYTLSIADGNRDSQTSITAVVTFNGTTDTVTARVSISSNSITIAYRNINCIRLSP